MHDMMRKGGELEKMRGSQNCLSYQRGEEKEIKFKGLEKNKTPWNTRNLSRSGYLPCSRLGVAICGPEKEILQILTFDIPFAVAPKLQ